MAKGVFGWPLFFMSGLTFNNRTERGKSNEAWLGEEMQNADRRHRDDSLPNSVS